MGPQNFKYMTYSVFPTKMIKRAVQRGKKRGGYDARDNMNYSIIDVPYVYLLPRLVYETLSLNNSVFMTYKLLVKVSDISESEGTQFNIYSDKSCLLSRCSYMTS